MAHASIRIAAATAPTITGTARRKGASARARPIITLHRVGGHEAIDHNAAALVHIPDYGFADRIALVADDGALRHLPPEAVDRHPIGAVADVVGRAMTV